MKLCFIFFDRLKLWYFIHKCSKHFTFIILSSPLQQPYKVGKYYYPHITVGEAEGDREASLHQATQWVHSGVEIQTGDVGWFIGLFLSYYKSCNQDSQGWIWLSFSPFLPLEPKCVQNRVARMFESWTVLLPNEWEWRPWRAVVCRNLHVLQVTLHHDRERKK